MGHHVGDSEVVSGRERYGTLCSGEHLTAISSPWQSRAVCLRCVYMDLRRSSGDDFVTSVVASRPWDHATTANPPRSRHSAYGGGGGGGGGGSTGNVSFFSA